MHEIGTDNARQYLEQAGLIGPAETAVIRALTGGVSNMVLLVERPSGARFVVKQARRQLRTREPWFSRLERIWREIDVLQCCQQILAQAADGESHGPPLDARYRLPSIRTPQVVFVDRDNYLFAMTAAPPDAVVWKADLLAARYDPRIATACGLLLARIHAGSWREPALAIKLADRSLFDELRVDPYYRAVARAHPALRSELEQLIASLDAHCCALVHADFSPKNLLVSPQGLMMVDFETGHYGDPAFDLGFFQSHLLLKAFYHAPDWAAPLDMASQFWLAYRAQLAQQVSADELDALQRRAVRHCAGCLLARIDGKSPVDYLHAPERQAAVRRLAIALLREPSADWSSTLARCGLQLETIGADRA